MNFESNFADAPFTVVFNPVKNITIGIIPKRKNSRSIGVPIHDVFYFLTFSEKTAENKWFESATYDWSPSDWWTP